MDPFLLAWKVARVLPRGVVRFVTWTVVNVAWLFDAKPARRLSANLARVTDLDGAALRHLTRRGMVTVARYYSEVLESTRITPEVLDARVRIEGRIPEMSKETGTVAVLGHLGNWDLVGAYAARHVMPITAVAEVLKPREVFDEFVAMRAALGIRVLGHEGGATFRELIRITRSEEVLTCLVADRDLSGRGVHVTMWGHTVKVAPGPAALAQAVKVPLVPVLVHSERLRGARRRAARSKWGIVMAFGTVFDPADFTGDDAVAKMTQAWATELADFIRAHPQDWHMLQRFGWVDAE